MSKNAATKRRAKRWHRDQFSRYPTGKVQLADMLRGFVPASTPFWEMLRPRLQSVESSTAG